METYIDGLPSTLSPSTPLVQAPEEPPRSSSCWGRCWSRLYGAVSGCVSGVTRRVGSCFKASEGFLRRYGDWVSSCIDLTVSSVFLYGCLDHKISPDVAKTAYLALNYIGLISLCYNAPLFIKVIKDGVIACRTRNAPIAIESISKTATVGAGIVFLGMWAAAATESLEGHPNVTLWIYKNTRPVGFAVLGVNILLDLYHYRSDKKVLKTLEVGLEDEEVHTVSTLLAEKKEWNYEGLYKDKGAKFAATIRRRMNKDDLISLQKALRKVDPEDTTERRKLIEIRARDNIRTEYNVAIANIWLRVLGDGGIALSDLHPGGLLQASIATGSSLGYTIKLSIQKWREKKVRDEIEGDVVDMSMESV